MRQTIPEHELSRPLFVDKISAGGLQEHIVARPAECAALAKRFGLVEIKRFEAFINIDHAEGHMLAVTGNVQADVVQSCVVTLEPLPASVKETFDLLFAPPALIKRAAEGALANIGEADFPEPIENGVIDLGELAAQYLALGLDPYPRKQGVSFDSAVAEAKEAEIKPFAGLKAVLEKTDKSNG